MEERLKELLNTDIDEVVAQGKKSGNKRKKIVSIIAVIALIACVSGYFINRNEKYKNATLMADFGLYADAMDEFTKLGSYKDSQDNIQKIIVAKDFTESSCYQQQYKLIENSFSQVSADVVVYLEWRTMTVVTKITLPEETKLTAEDLKGDLAKEIGLLPVFLSFCHSADNVCTILQKSSGDEGYSVNYRTEFVGYDGDSLYSSLNGEECFSCIDMSKAWDEVYANCYDEIVRKVNQEDYAAACTAWDTFNSNMIYELDYKDISDYYYYAKAMKVYKGNGKFSLSEVEENLAQVSDDFKDAESIKSSIKSKKEAISGTYVNDGKYRVFLSDNRVEVSLPYELYYGLTGSDGAYMMENGEITSVKATVGSSYSLEATFNSNGMMVNCTKLPSSYTNFLYYGISASEISGQYSFESKGQVGAIY
jgi:hypothetical protein